MRKINNAILLVSILFILVSCNSSKSETPDLHIMGIQLVRFKSPEYIKYVVAEKVSVEFDTIKGYPSDMLVGTKSAYKIRNMGGVCQELFLGQYPYIELADGYYLVDWKWGDFIYKPSNVLIGIAWQDVQDRHEIWNLQTSVVSSDFIIDWGSTTRLKIDKYLQQTPSPKEDGYSVSSDHIRPYWYGTYHSLTEIQDDLSHDTYYSVDKYMSEVARQDSLQNVYIERLKQIIQDGNLKIVANIYDN